MTCDSGKSNRRLISYYRRKTNELGYDTKLLITHIVGSESDILPHKETITLGVDYYDSTLSFLNEIRPHLQAEFREMSNEDLLVSGVFLVARKPLTGLQGSSSALLNLSAPLRSNRLCT